MNSILDLLSIKEFGNGGKYTFPVSTMVKNQQLLSGKRNMSKKTIKSDRPMYNSNRIIRKRFEGGDLTLNSTLFAQPRNLFKLHSFTIPDIISTSLKSEKEDDLSDIKKCKTLEDIMLEMQGTILEKSELEKLYDFRVLLNDSINKYTGIPYVFGGKTTLGLDCSGFTSKVMQNMGVKLTGGTLSQWSQTKHIDTLDLLVGDLVFLKGTIEGRRPDLPSHVAIVTDTSNLKEGKIKVAEASGSGKQSLNGRVWDLNNGYYNEHWLGAGRVF